jgi:carbon monoxide dehydrogenase subunit G
MWMSKRKRATGLFAAVIALAALAVPVVASADHPGQTVKIKTTITINPVGSAGSVMAPNENCVEGRQVVVKEVGVGKIGAAKVTATGRWTAEPRYKGNVPFKVFAEVKPVSEGTAGTIYKCLGASSKIRTINGG